MSDKVIITVIPRDGGGNPLLKNVPDGVDLSVSLYTDLGTISNQSLNKTTGEITADLTSTVPGKATVRAKIVNDYVSGIVNGQEYIVVAEVTFISDAILPKRRFVSKPNKTASQKNTAGGPERSPGVG